VRSAGDNTVILLTFSEIFGQGGMRAVGRQ
jgi:hypothetical protein